MFPLALEDHLMSNLWYSCSWSSLLLSTKLTVQHAHTHTHQLISQKRASRRNCGSWNWVCYFGCTGCISDKGRCFLYAENRGRANPNNGLTWPWQMQTTDYTHRRRQRPQWHGSKVKQIPFKATFCSNAAQHNTSIATKKEHLLNMLAESVDCLAVSRTSWEQSHVGSRWHRRVSLWFGVYSSARKVWKVAINRYKKAANALCCTETAHHSHHLPGEILREPAREPLCSLSPVPNGDLTNMPPSRETC